MGNNNSATTTGSTGGSAQHQLLRPHHTQQWIPPHATHMPPHGVDDDPRNRMRKGYAVKQYMGHRTTPQKVLPTVNPTKAAKKLKPTSNGRNLKQLGTISGRKFDLEEDPTLGSSSITEEMSRLRLGPAQFRISKNDPRSRQNGGSSPNLLRQPDDALRSAGQLTRDNRNFHESEPELRQNGLSPSVPVSHHLQESPAKKQIRTKKKSAPPPPEPTKSEMAANSKFHAQAQLASEATKVHHRLFQTKADRKLSSSSVEPSGKSSSRQSVTSSSVSNSAISKEIHSSSVSNSAISKEIHSSSVSETAVSKEIQPDVTPNIIRMRNKKVNKSGASDHSVSPELALPKKHYIPYSFGENKVKRENSRRVAPPNSKNNKQLINNFEPETAAKIVPEKKRFYFGMDLVDFGSKPSRPTLDDIGQCSKKSEPKSELAEVSTFSFYKTKDVKEESLSDNISSSSEMDIVLRPTLPPKPQQLPKFSPSAAWNRIDLDSPNSSEEEALRFNCRTKGTKMGGVSQTVGKERLGEGDSGISGLDGDGGGSPEILSPPLPIATSLTKGPCWTPEQDLDDSSSEFEGEDDDDSPLSSGNLQPAYRSSDRPRLTTRRNFFSSKSDTEQYKDEHSFAQVKKEPIYACSTKAKGVVNGTIITADGHPPNTTHNIPYQNPNHNQNPDPNQNTNPNHNHNPNHNQNHNPNPNHYPNPKSNVNPIQDLNPNLASSNNRTHNPNLASSNNRPHQNPNQNPNPSLTTPSDPHPLEFKPSLNRIINYRRTQRVNKEVGLDANWFLSRSEPNSLNMTHLMVGGEAGPCGNEDEEEEGIRSENGYAPTGISFEIAGTSISQSEWNKSASLISLSHFVYLPQQRSVLDDTSSSSKRNRRTKSVENLLKQNENSTQKMTEKTEKNLPQNQLSPQVQQNHYKRKKFKFQSTLKVMERKRIEKELSREAEEKEIERLKEIEAMKRVEEEFQRKRKSKEEEQEKKTEIQIQNGGPKSKGMLSNSNVSRVTSISPWEETPKTRTDLRKTFVRTTTPSQFSDNSSTRSTSNVTKVNLTQRQDPEGAPSVHDMRKELILGAKKRNGISSASSDLTQELSEFRQERRQYCDYRSSPRLSTDVTNKSKSRSRFVDSTSSDIYPLTGRTPLEKQRQRPKSTVIYPEIVCDIPNKPFPYTVNFSSRLSGSHTSLLIEERPTSGVGFTSGPSSVISDNYRRDWAHHHHGSKAGSTIANGAKSSSITSLHSTPDNIRLHQSELTDRTSHSPRIIHRVIGGRASKTKELAGPTTVTITVEPSQSRPLILDDSSNEMSSGKSKPQMESVLQPQSFINYKTKSYRPVVFNPGNSRPH